MLSVSQADKIIAESMPRFPSEEIFLNNCAGRVLAEEILADRDDPPAAKSKLDGIALSSSAVKKGNRRFPIIFLQKAGDKPRCLKSGESCAEITTGALVPEGCDCVVPYEDIRLESSSAYLLKPKSAKAGGNILPIARNFKKGDKLLKRGEIITTPVIAILASVGKRKPRVCRRAHMAIVSTGDELVDVRSQHPADYQVRRSNTLAIMLALNKTGLFKTRHYHCPDNKSFLRTRLKFILRHFDGVILSGGVSKGKFDFVPGVLTELGVSTLIHRVRQKPGKPLWFGITSDGKPVFALPGNPVSSLIGIYRYVLPAFRNALGIKIDTHKWVALRAFHIKPLPLTLFIPARLTSSPREGTTGQLIKTLGSMDLASLAHSDGFVEIPAARKASQKHFRFYPWE